MVNKDNKYTHMQKRTYDKDAELWSISKPDYVVGSFHQHNDWPGYEYLFRSIDNMKEKIGLDFACGPGRNLVKYQHRFQRLDGIDLSPINIEKARQYLDNNGIYDNKLYVSNGIDCNTVESDTYDVVMSTIALQHICVYDIRFSIMTDIYRVLKTGGVFTAQMGYGHPSPRTVDYYANYYDATGTNRECDVCISDATQLKNDLQKIGFKNFTYIIDRTGPGDVHPNWIYFDCTK